jgi:apolipoprotein N-acyltransferase
VRLPRLSRVGRGVLAVALGAALSLVFPTVSAWWYAYVGLVPIIALVVAAPTRRAAGWLSVFAAFGFYVGLHHWLVPAIGPFTVPVAFALALLWLPFGLVAWSLLREPTGLRIAAAVALLPAIWLVVEFFRSWDRFGGSWGLLGLSQWQVHPVLAIAALGGVWLLSLLLVVVNVLLAAAALPGARAAHRAVCGGSAAAMVALAVIYGVSRPDPPVDRVVRIGGVQPGVVHSPEARLAANEELTRSLEDESVELVVWGQSSVGFDPELADDVRDRLVAAARGVGVDVLVNVDAPHHTPRTGRPRLRQAATGAVRGVHPTSVGARVGRRRHRGRRRGPGPGRPTGHHRDGRVARGAAHLVRVDVPRPPACRVAAGP